MEEHKDEWLSAAEDVLKAGQAASQSREGIAPMARLVAGYYLSLIEARIDKEDARDLASDFLRLLWLMAAKKE